MKQRKPNIIIINPDEMRWDTMGHMGNPAAFTPNLDAFAQQDAVSFSHAYCQNPVCVPSRCSFLTGLYPHTQGHRTMDYLLHEEESSLFSELRNAGYHVWMNARNDLLASQIPGLLESHADEIYYGDDDSDSVESEKTPSRNSGRGRSEDHFPFSHFGGITANSDDQDMKDTLAAIHRIQTWSDEKPLCIFLGWVNPHPPYLAEQKYYDCIASDKISQRVQLCDTDGKSAMIHRLHELVELDAFTQEQWQELRHVYLAQCAKVDDMFSMVCEALKERGIYDDSAIFVLSDHGDFAGDYDLPEKAQNTFEDCLTRVPLLIKPPKDCVVDPGISDSLVELVDFYATAMDYAGVEPDHDQFGRSLRPVIENRNTLVREYVCCEGGRMPGEWQADEYHAQGPDTHPIKGPYWPKMKAQSDPLVHEKGTMIFDGHYKYVERPSGLNELYNMLTDPNEKYNIYSQEENNPQLLALRLKMLTWYQQTCDVVPKKRDSRTAPEKLWQLVRGMCPPAYRATLKAEIMAHPDINPFALMRMAIAANKGAEGSEAAKYAGL